MYWPKQCATTSKTTPATGNYVGGMYGTYRGGKGEKATTMGTQQYLPK